MSDALVPCDVAENVAVLTLNRPQALNALSDALLAALTQRLDTIAADPAIRVVVIRGAGKVFCAGHDLKEMQAGRAAADKGAAYFADLFARCGSLMQKIPTMPQPVIAQVHGIATAAGCQLVASCDMAVAATDARFGVNGVNIGLFCSTPMVALTVAGKLGAAVRIGKRAFYDQIALPLDQAYAHTGAVMVENMLLRDTDEGISAFIDKRRPDWA